MLDGSQFSTQTANMWILWRSRASPGATPKVIWLDVGNAGTNAIADLLTVEHPRVEAFHANPEEALLVLELPVEHAV